MNEASTTEAAETFESIEPVFPVLQLQRIVSWRVSGLRSDIFTGLLLEFHQNHMFRDMNAATWGEKVVRNWNYDIEKAAQRLN